MLQKIANFLQNIQIIFQKNLYFQGFDLVHEVVFFLSKLKFNSTVTAIFFSSSTIVISLMKSKSDPKDNIFSFKTLDPLPVKKRLKSELKILFLIRGHSKNNNSTISSNRALIIFFKISFSSVLLFNLFFLRILIFQLRPFDNQYSTLLIYL